MHFGDQPAPGTRLELWQAAREGMTDVVEALGIGLVEFLGNPMGLGSLGCVVFHVRNGSTDDH